jgi:hypothetical protein
MTLKTPTKSLKNKQTYEIDGEDCSQFRDTAGCDDIIELRQRFVGEVNLPEGISFYANSLSYLLNSSSDQEPLLMESRRRFVLFPIQYPEVRLHNPVIMLVCSQTRR